MKITTNGFVNTENQEEIPFGVEIVGAPPAWKFTRGEGVRLCLLDSGIDAAHEDLNVVVQRSFCANDSDPSDLNGHGTLLAGSVAAKQNDVGVVGVAPAASLVSAKVLGAEGSGTIEDINRALQWCVSELPDVICMSFGAAGEADIASQELILKLADAGVIVVTGPSRTAQGVPLYPGNCRGVISVSSWPDSWGEDVGDVACWAGSMKTTGVGGGYTRVASRSSSVGLVAGAAGLLKAIKRNIGVDEMRMLLQTTSDNPSIWQHKQVNVFAAIKQITSA
ncbi:S8 family peptidase [Bradyrhizobium monzae]|uniref:S8 family peptidase n=1 Tax=Bradyrhizobium sp. Oc8 TaxID=2876780 RepID=UPI001F2E063F|nr:S8 family serine peptidase [Bradyrhizobium sp. Oc8]